MAEPVEAGTYSLLYGGLWHNLQTADRHDGRALYPHLCEQLENVLSTVPFTF